MILDYARLERITTVEKPYRKSTNRYPLENRKCSYKYFIEEQLDGEKVYAIVYGHKYEQEPITIEEYNADIANSKNSHIDTVTKTYYRYRKVPNKIGIVHPDNTFEFITDFKIGLGQGVRIHFNNGWFRYGTNLKSSTKHGGVIVTFGYGADAITHPVFKGLRISLDTGEAHSSCKYEVHRKIAIRKKVNELCKPYKKPLDTALLMLNNMTKETVVAFIREEVASKRDTDSSIPKEEIQKAKNSMIDTPIDSLLLLAYEWATSYGFRYMIESPDNNSSRSWVYDNFSVNTCMLSVIKKFKRDLCESNSMTILTEEVSQAGDVYKSSEWGVDVRVNNQLVQQYQY